MGSSTQNATNFFFQGFSQHSSAAFHARVWTPVGTGLSTPRDGVIMARPKLAGHQGDSRDTSNFVTSCPIGMSLPADSACEGRIFLHFTQPGLSISAAAGVVDKKGSEYILAHTGPRELDGHPLGGCGSEFDLVPNYTTLLIRVRPHIRFGALKIKCVRTKPVP